MSLLSFHTAGLCLRGRVSLIRYFSALTTDSCRAVNLSFAVFESKTKNQQLSPPLFLLHGLFGSKKNFESIAKHLSQTGRQLVTIDARNHGDSPHSPEMNYQAMSEDLELLLKTLGLRSAIFLGHSMGGKAAMTLALTKPQLVDMLIVEDISPTSSRSMLVTSFPEYIEAMRKVTFDPEVKTLTQARRIANEQLMKTFPEKPLRDFILTNIDQRNGKIMWRINLDALQNNLQDIIEFPQFPKPYDGRTVFIAGRNSPQIRLIETIFSSLKELVWPVYSNFESDYPEIQRLFPRAVVRHIEGAGHWAHSDKPQEFIDIVKQILHEFEHRESI